ncbi:MAG: alpha/beta hydrolase [Deltaproteobacteria bacterium]|nr:alpha/beta hydrolase [Deltaproteobacteria bacterium]
MAEEAVTIEVDGLRIEGLYDPAPGARAVVVTHPHPLYGGSMVNNVVEDVVRAYKAAGYATLRFNFRGVGRSGGTYGEGIGEQDDVSAALAYLASMGKPSIDLAGYSFGAWVNAMGVDRFEAAGRLIMVSPPVGFLDFSFLQYCEKIQLVIAGSADDIGPPDKIRQMLPKWNPQARLEVISGADHFYGGKGDDIARIIQSFLNANKEFA